MGKLEDYLNRMETKKEEEEKSSYSDTTGEDTLSRYLNKISKTKMESTIGLDTLSTDLSTLGTTIQGVSTSWQTPETMANTKASVESMYNRLTAFQEYQNKYMPNANVDFRTTFDDLGVPLSQRTLYKSPADYVTKTRNMQTESIINGYKNVLDNWDALSERYSGYKTKEEYDNAIEEYKSKTTANLDEKKTEIAELEGILEKAKKYETELNDYENSKRVRDKYSNGLKLNGEYNKRFENEQAKYDEKIAQAQAEYDEYLASVGYSNIGELETDVARKSAYYDDAKSIQESIALDKKHKEMAKSKEAEDGLERFYADEEKAKVEKSKSAEANAKIRAMTIAGNDNAGAAMMSSLIDSKRSDDSYKKPKEDWTEEERLIFGAYYSENPESAYEYATKLNNEKALAEKGKGKSKIIGNATQSVGSGAKHTLGAILTAPLGLADYIDDITDIASGRGTIVEEGGVTPFEYSQAVTSGISSKLNEYGTLNEDIPIIGSKGWGDVYGLGTSIAQSGASAVTLGGWGTLVSYFGQGAAAGVDDALSRGATSEQALLYGTILGAAEGVSEKIGVDNLFKLGASKTLKQAFLNVLKQAGAEGGEEMFSSVVGQIADNFVMQDKSNFNALVNKYLAEGMSVGEAKNKAWLESVGDIAFDTLSGALSGGLHAMPHTAIQTATAHSYDKTAGASIRSNERVGDMLDVVQNMTPEESSAYEIYTRYAKKGVNADNISDAQLGNLYFTAREDAIKTLDSRKSTEQQKVQAINTLNEMNKMYTENTYKKKAKASTIEAQEKTSELNVGEVTEVTSTGNSTNIEGIKVEGDNITLVTSEGEVSIDDMTFNQKDSALVGNAQQIAIEYGNDVANVFLSQYDGKTDVDAYANSFNLVIQYTSNNLTEDTILANKGVLSTEQVKAVYNATVHQQYVNMENAINTIVEKQGKNMTIKGTFDDSIIDKNSTNTDGKKVNWNSLSERQRNAIKFAKMFSKATGVNIRFIQSKVEGGKRVGKNGSYNPETNTIEIDVYAGVIDAKSINDSIIPTLAHEITHWAKYKAPAIYDTLRNEVMGTLAESGITSEDRINKELARLRKAHPDKTYTEEDAIDEIVARACEDMLTNSNSVRKMLNKMSAKEQKKFLAKIKETFENLMQWINDLLAQYKSGSAEAETLREYKDKLKEISKTWDAMIEQAVVSNQALQKEGILGEALVNGISKDGTTIRGENNLQMSDRTYREGGREFLINWLDGHRGLTEADKQDIIDQTDRIAELMRAIENEEDLPDYSNWANMEVVKDENGEKVLSVIVKNGDYAMNIDFSQVCKKRVALNAVLNAMVQSGDLNVYTLTETDVADLNAIIKEHEFEIACALCFVDSKRYRVGSWAKSFCEGTEKKKSGKMVHQYGFNEMVRSLVPKGSKIKIDEYNFTGRGLENQPTKNLLSEADDSELDFTLIDEIMKRESKADGKSTDLYAYAKAIKDNKSLRKILNPAEIISSIGLDAIRLAEPELYRLINRHQGTARPKFSHDVVAYGNDILKAKGFSAEKAKMVGGVRCQSFSDFMANMVIDYAQFVSELSAKELTSHTYTKEPLFVKLFGLTGMKINMSLVPKAIDMTPEQQKQFAILKDKNANKRSAEYKEALKEYAKLSKNAGLDENGNYIWEDETFPYDVAMELVVDPRYSANCGTIAVGISDNHIRKLLADENISMVIPYHKSGLNHDVAMMRDIALYRDYTNVQSTRFSNGKKLKGVPDFDFYGDLYGVDGKEGTHDPKKTAENYLEWCREHKYLPKFNAFASDPNYYKLLVDFRVYDTDGTYREQQPVKAIYPSNEEFKDLILNGVKDKNGKVYGGLKQQQGNADRLSAESQQIIDEYREVLKEKYGKDVLKEKFSDRDSEGNTLTDEQIEFFKDSKVRDAEGNLRVVYHGTPTGGFTEFNLPHYLHSHTSAQGAGYYFTDRKNAEQYTKALNGKILTKKQLYQVYLNITNPLEISEYSTGAITDDAFRRIMARGNYKWGMEHTDVEKRLQVSKYDSDRLAEMVKVFNGEEILKVMKEELGHDGVRFTDRYGDIWVAWDKSQIKNIDNTNPTDNPDIRYSDREESLSTEELYNLMGENEKLKKQKQVLAEDVERLRERLRLESKVTNGEFFSSSQLLGLAGHLRKMANSTIDKVRLAEMLRDATKVISKLDTSNMTPDELFNEHLLPIAYAIAEEGSGQVIKDEYVTSILKGIRSSEIWLSDSQKAEITSRYGGKWNNHLFGKFKISDNRNNDLESKWQHWAKTYPSIFDAEISEAEIGIRLLEIYDDLKKASEIVSEYNEQEVAMELAKEIYTQCWTFRPIKTTADRYTERIKKLTSEHRQAMKELKDTYEDKVEKQKVADAMYYGRVINNIRTRKDKEIAEAKKIGKERMDKYKDNAERKTRIQRITSNVLDLSRKLIKNSKDQHIPEVMKPIIVELVQALDFSSKRMLDKGVPTQKDISLYKSLERVQQMMSNATSNVEGLEQLYGHNLDDRIAVLVSTAFNTLRDFGDNEFILNHMSAEDLATLDETVRFIKHVVNAVNKFYVAKHSQGVANLSKESVSEMRDLGDGKKFGEKSIIGGAVKLLNWKNINPLYAFKRFGEGGRKIFEALQDGWDKFAFNVNQILEFTKNVYTDNEVEEWSEKVETFEITEPVSDAERADPDYKPKKIKVRMTTAQIMSLYCLNKREQARGHLLGGGMRVADFEDGKKTVSQTNAVILTENTIAEITGRLSKRQIEVADKLQEFLNTVCPNWGNEVSMLRFGYNAFGELNYFPIQSDENNLAVNDATDNPNSLFRLLNMSFSKALTEKADNTIVISNIFDVFAQHSSDMAKYNALALPVLDAFRWYNFVEKQQKGEIEGNTPHKTMSVKEAMEKAFGNDAKSYFKTFLRDINGTQNVSRDTLGHWFFKNTKIAAVGANLRVVLLQPTSYLRANAVINPKYLTKALLHKPRSAEAIKHCGMALWKSLGYYDTNVQRSVEEQIKHSQTKKDKMVEWAMNGAEVADKITWGYLWNACEFEIRDTRKDLKVGSKEFYEAIGKRLRDVIYATQVVDSTMTRSELMRSSDGRDKMLTAFASEPTLAYNMLYDAYMELHLDARKMGKKEAWKKNGKRVARVIMAYTVTNMVAALVEAGFDAFRDDDEEEKDLVYFMKLYFSNLASDMSITGKIPYIKEAHSILKGFSSSRTDTQWMESLTKAAKEVLKFAEGEGDPAKLIKRISKVLADVTGLPFYNMYRDANAMLDLLTGEDLEEMFNEFFE